MFSGSASLYLLSLGLTLAFVADGAKRWGSLRLYTVSLIGFTVVSGLSALAPSPRWLVTARVVQGLFGGPLVPLAMNMMFGGDGHAQKQMPAMAGMVLFLAPAIAPALGCVLIHWGGWPLIFLVNVPLGVMALLGVSHIPTELGGLPQATRPRFDSVGFAGLATALTAVTYGAVEGPQRGWRAAGVWPPFGPGNYSPHRIRVVGKTSKAPHCEHFPISQQTGRSRSEFVCPRVDGYLCRDLSGTSVYAIHFGAHAVGGRIDIIAARSGNRSRSRDRESIVP